MCGPGVCKLISIRRRATICASPVIRPDLKILTHLARSQVIAYRALSPMSTENLSLDLKNVGLSDIQLHPEMAFRQEL